MRTEKKVSVRTCARIMAQVCLPVAGCTGSLAKTSRSEMSTVHSLDFNPGFSVEHAL